MTPPGYTPAAAQSAARRYSRRLRAGLGTSARGEGEFTIQPDELARLEGSPLGAMWLGHASVLLRVHGRWILTDPVFSHRIGVRFGPVTLGVPRLLPAPAQSSLPKLDLILLSHAHFDHLDTPTLRALRSTGTRVVTAARTGPLVPRGFGDVRALDWEEGLEFDGLRLRALRPAHWGARTIWDKHRGFNSYVLDVGGSRVLYAGDTAMTDAYRAVASEGGSTDLTIFGIGAYDPWIHAHASPEQAWQMHTDARGRFLFPMHHSTFELSDEPMDEPLRRLRAHAAAHGASGADASTTIAPGDLGRAWIMPPGSEHPHPRRA